MGITLGERTEATERIRYRRMRDPVIRQTLPMEERTLEEALENFRKSQQPGARSFGRTIWLGERYIGDVWCYAMDLAEDPQGMLSYCVFETGLWNQGAATEAVGLFLEELRERFGLERLGAFTYAANTGSIRVLEKNGFRLAESFMEDGVESRYYVRSRGVLLAGFKGRSNSSCRLVSALAGEKYFLTNSFPGLERDIARLRDEYRAVCLFGLDKALRESVRIELCAAGEAGVLRTRLEPAALIRRFDQMGISYSIADQPTQYLCNAAYYRLLEKMSCPVVLIHIPSQRNLSQELFSRLITAFSRKTESIS